jgi:hypothetical protein
VVDVEACLVGHVGMLYPESVAAMLEKLASARNDGRRFVPGPVVLVPN